MPATPRTRIFLIAATALAFVAAGTAIAYLILPAGERTSGFSASPVDVQPDPFAFSPSTDSIALYWLPSDSVMEEQTGVKRLFAFHEVESSESTSFWVGCDGTPAVSEFLVPFESSALRARLTLDPAITPAGLEVAARILADGTEIDRWALDPETLTPVSIDIPPGTNTVSLEAVVTSGVCGEASVGYGSETNMGYGVAVDGIVSRVGGVSPMDGIRKSDPLTMGQPSADFDLDADPGVRWSAADGMAGDIRTYGQLEAINGASITQTRGDGTARSCASETYAGQGLYDSDLRRGDVFCVSTNQGRFARLEYYGKTADQELLFGTKVYN